MSRVPRVYEGEFENWSKARPATAGEKFAILGTVFLCCLLMAGIVFDLLTSAQAVAAMLLPAGALLAYIQHRPGRRLRPAYLWALIAGFALMAGSLMQVHVLSELCFAGLGLVLLVLTFMEKKGLKYE